MANSHSSASQLATPSPAVHVVGLDVRDALPHMRRRAPGLGQLPDESGPEHLRASDIECFDRFRMFFEHSRQRRVPLES